MKDFVCLKSVILSENIVALLIRHFTALQIYCKTVIQLGFQFSDDWDTLTKSYGEAL